MSIKCINIIATIEQYNGPQWCHGGMNAPLVFDKQLYTVMNTSGTSTVHYCIALYMCLCVCVWVYVYMCASKTLNSSEK